MMMPKPSEQVYVASLTIQLVLFQLEPLLTP